MDKRNRARLLGLLEEIEFNIKNNNHKTTWRNIKAIKTLIEYDEEIWKITSNHNKASMEANGTAK